MKYFYFLILFLNSSFAIAQTQIGATLYGTANVERFGESISMSNNGNRMAVGVPFNNDQGNHTGNIKIYDWINGNWALTGNIYGPNNSYISNNVHLSDDGNTIIATTSDFVSTANTNICIYEFQNGTWTMTWNLTSAINSNVGYSASISGDGNTFAYTDYNLGNDQSSLGIVYIVRKINNIWTEIGVINENSLNIGYGNGFGHTTKLSHDGNKIFISAPRKGTLHSFQYENGQWTPYGGTILETNNSAQHFGESFSLNSNSDLIAIGNNFYNRTTTNNGAVTFYSLINGLWQKMGQITGAPDAMIGKHVSLSDNNLVAISSIKNNLNQSISGSLLVYKIDLANQIYTQLGNTINAGYNDFLIVNEISKTSNKVMTSAYNADSPNNSQAGYVKVFDYGSFLNTIEINKKKPLNIYPNPTKGKIYFDGLENKIKSVKVFNTNQQLIFEKIIQISDRNIDIPHIPGTYFVTFYLMDSTTLTKKIIIE